VHEDREAALVARAARGDRAAFSALAAAHEARLRQFVVRVVGPGDADDVAQEALVKAWLSLAAYRGDAPFGAWLAGIAWRGALDHRRRARRATARDTAWSGERDGAAHGPGAAPVELERALAALSDLERAALVLTHGHGWSHAEAARILGLPLGTLKSLALRARAKARAALDGASPELETAA
jgi:DNA-directed RNA polymerase specialized sigma24 family protein